MTYLQAINKATEEELEKGNLYLFGQDIKLWGGQGGVFKGLNQKFPGKLYDTPIAEAATAGLATGMAMSGKHVLVEYGFLDFILHSSDQIINQASKINYLSNGQFSVPVTYYATINSDRGYGATHSQSLENIFFKVPGLEVVYPSNSVDAYDLLKLSLDGRNPTLFLTHKLLLESESGIDIQESSSIEEDNSNSSQKDKKARIIKEGNALTVVSYGRCIHMVLKALENLNINNVEVIDLRYLNPLDIETIKTSVLKTKRLLLVEEGYGVVSSEVLANVLERIGDKYIESHRLYSKFESLGVNRVHEEDVIVNVKKIEEKIKSVI